MVLSGPEFFGDFHRISHGMGAFQRWNNAFNTRQNKESVQTFLVCNRFILDAADIFQIAVLRADTRIIESGRNRINRQWIAFFILQVIAFETVERSLRAKAQGSSMIRRIQSFTGRLDTRPVSRIHPAGIQ